MSQHQRLSAIVAGFSWKGMRHSFIGLLLIAGNALADDSLIHWTDTSVQLDRAQLRSLLDEKVSGPLERFISDELRLDKSVSVVISERPYGFYEQDRNQVFVPLANLYRVYDDLRLKYPEQSEVQQSIFKTTMQFYLLSEIVRGIVVDKELRITGWEAERIDGLSAIVLLQNGQVEQAFLLDAAEEFLLIDRAVGSVQAERFKTEFEADEYRLGQIFCIIEAFDSDGFARKAWGPRECSGQYQTAMAFWAEALKEYWVEGTRFARWQSKPDS